MTFNPGPAFWMSTYGVTDFDDFYARVGAYLPDIGVLFIHLSPATVAQLAWNDPLSGPGEVAAAVLSAQELAGSTPSGSHAIARAIAPHASLRGGGNMPPLVIANVYRCSVQAHSGSRPVDNVFGLQGSAGGQEVAAAAALKTAWTAAGGPLNMLPLAYVVDQYTAMDLTSATAGQAVATGAAATGGGSGDSATVAACALIKYNGGSRSRSTRGRTYFGPLTEAQVQTDGRSLSTAWINTIGGAWTIFKNSLSSSGFPLCVISVKLSQAFPVTSFVVEGTIATQRRRIRH